MGDNGLRCGEDTWLLDGEGNDGEVPFLCFCFRYEKDLWDFFMEEEGSCKDSKNSLSLSLRSDGGASEARIYMFQICSFKNRLLYANAYFPKWAGV